MIGAFAGVRKRDARPIRCVTIARVTAKPENADLTSRRYQR